MDYQYAHEDQMGGVDLSGTAVTVAIVCGPIGSATASEVRALIDSHEAVGQDDDYSVEIISVAHSYSDLYAIMYVLPTALGIDIGQTHVHCSVDVVRNRVKAGFDPFAGAIAVRSAELWGSMVDVGPLPADSPRLVARTRRRNA